MKRTYKDSKGITLVATIIIIIILIILAGVSINTLIGTDGLITKAQQAKENIELAEIQEQTRLNELFDQIDTELTGTGNSFSEKTIGTVTSDKILKDYTAYVNGQLVTGSMNDYSENVQEITLPANHTTNTEYSVSAGYHTKMKVDASAVYDAGYQAGMAAAMANIGGNATASDILSGKTAYVNGQLVTGNIVQRSAGGNITTYGYNSSQGKGYVYFNAGYYPVNNATYGTYVWLTKDQVKALANACGVGYDAGKAAGDIKHTVSFNAADGKNACWVKIDGVLKSQGNLSWSWSGQV